MFCTGIVQEKYTTLTHHSLANPMRDEFYE